MSKPEALRPYMPGYGISTDVEGALDWSWAEIRLTESRNYFVGTTRPDGRPHAMPVWAVWQGDRLWFSTAKASTKAQNLLENPSVAVCIEGGAEAVIVEGTATIEEATSALSPVWSAYKAKYGWDLTGESMFVVTPAKVFAFIESAEEFEKSATRWILDPK